MTRVKIKFWGVRGSTPSPSPQTVKYGGNTPCVEIVAGKHRIICDAGTGIQELGRKLRKSGNKIDATIFLSHIHWDHISGLPFFEPLYMKKNSFQIVGPKIKRMTLKAALGKAISPPFFPVALKDAPAKLKFKSVTDKSFKCGKIIVRPFQLSHPGGAQGWRFEFSGGKSLIYISDNEPGKNKMQLIEWAKDADIMIHDAQYTPSEYKHHKGWGHSPYTYPIEIAKAAGVKRLILSHFDPTHTDREMDRLSKSVKKQFRCEPAKEGKILHLR
jgi:phosphoribosyl 1,2-cyclic phosphodiesterase